MASIETSAPFCLSGQCSIRGLNSRSVEVGFESGCCDVSGRTGALEPIRNRFAIFQAGRYLILADNAVITKSIELTIEFGFYWIFVQCRACIIVLWLWWKMGYEKQKLVHPRLRQLGEDEPLISISMQIKQWNAPWASFALHYENEESRETGNTL